MKDTFGQLSMLAQDLIHTNSSKPKKIISFIGRTSAHLYLSLHILTYFLIVYMHRVKLCTKKETLFRKKEFNN